MAQPEQAMVLAAGYGTRLWPLTLDRAKPAVPFLGRPLVRHTVDHLIKHGVTDIAVNTHYLPVSVERALDRLNVGLSHEDEILGTAGALALAVRRGLLHVGRPVIIFNGKLFTNLDLTALLEHHRASRRRVTMALLPNPQKQAFREVHVEDERVTGFGEGREPEGDEPLLFTGIHVIEPDVLDTIPVAFSDTIRDVYPALIEAGEVGAFVGDPETIWWEFSTPERYLDLHARAAEAGLGTSTTLSAGVHVEPSAELEDVVIWENSRVGAHVHLKRVIIGADVTIPDGTSIEHAIIVRRELTDELRDGRQEGDLLIVPLRNEG